jgi:hypothetical protein
MPHRRKSGRQDLNLRTDYKRLGEQIGDLDVGDAHSVGRAARGR